MSTRTGPAFASAVKVTAPRLPAEADSVCAPTAGPSVQLTDEADPAASVCDESLPGLPALAVQRTQMPASALPF